MRDTNATVIVDLKPSIEEIYNALQKDARWGINKAEREGLVIEKIEENSKRGSEAWEEFYPIYVETMKNAGINLETLEHLKKYADVLFLCKKENKIIAGASLDVVDNVPKLSR